MQFLWPTSLWLLLLIPALIAAYVLAQDILDMALDVMRHRLVLSYEALSDNVSSDALVTRVLERISVPAQPMQEHVALHA